MGLKFEQNGTAEEMPELCKGQELPETKITIQYFLKKITL